MATNRKHRNGGRTTPKGTRPAGSGPRRVPVPAPVVPAWDLRTPKVDPVEAARDRAAEAFTNWIQSAYESEDPIELLRVASLELSYTDPRFWDPPGAADEVRGPRQLVAVHLRDERPATSGLLAVLAELVEDEPLALDIRNELERRNARPPAWIKEMGSAEVLRAVEQRDVLGDRDCILFDIGIGGHTVTLVVCIEHNLGCAVVDAFAMSIDVGQIQVQFEAKPDGEDLTWSAPDRAILRARVERAIARGVGFDPPLESPSWPQLRPLVEWVLRMLPAGGAVPHPVQWDYEKDDALLDRFVESPEALALGPEASYWLAGELISFGTSHGPGDPERWSPVNVEIFLADWAPRKLNLSSDDIASLPDVLRGFVRFCHRERGIRSARTDETMRSIDRCEPEFRQHLRETETSPLLRSK